MAEKQVVKALVVRINGKDAKLSIREAKRLHEALSELFDAPVVTVASPQPWPYPIYVRPSPYVWWSSASSHTLTMRADSPA